MTQSEQEQAQHSLLATANVELSVHTANTGNTVRRFNNFSFNYQQIFNIEKRPGPALVVMNNCVATVCKSSAIHCDYTPAKLWKLTRPECPLVAKDWFLENIF